MVRAFIENISESRFTEATLRRMYELVDSAKTNAEFQKLIAGVVNKAMPGVWKQYRREADSILRWVKAAVDYRRDPVDVELVQDPIRTLDRAAGDCDDMSVLLAAALETLGTPTRFVTVSTRADGSPSHVYIEAFLDGRWTSLDPIVKSSYVGWAPAQGITNKRVWTRTDVGMSGYEERPVEGLGMMDWTNDGIRARRNGTPLRPDEISHTRANPLPGELVSPPRLSPDPKVAKYADQPGLNLPGGEPRYSVRRSIQSHPTPSELRRFVPYDSPTFDPASIVGRIPNWESKENAVYPHPFDQGDPPGTDLSGLGAVEIHEAAALIDQMVASGRIPNTDQARSVAAQAAADELAASEEGHHDGMLGRSVRSRFRSTYRSIPTAIVARKILQASKTQQAAALRRGRSRAINGLGSVDYDPQAQSIATAVTQSVQSGDVPNSPGAISQAVDLAAQVWAIKQAQDAAKRAAALSAQQQAAAAQAAAYKASAAKVAPSGGGSPWVIPAVIAAGLVVVGGVLR